jgi:hypothetical protein
MIPSNKNAEMEEALTSFFGHDRRDSINADRCVPPPIGCGGPAKRFRDDLSAREFTISGLCQKCQDSIFNDNELEEKAKKLDYIAPTTTPNPSPKSIGPNDYATGRYEMICGSHDAERRVYRKYECKRGVWLVAVQPNAAENVYFHDPKDASSQGFAGRTLSFPLEDGTVYEAKGPWHSNADRLYKDTGIDVRNTHYTFVVLAMARDGWPTILRDVVYKDAQPVLGSFTRYKELIKRYPQAQVYYSESSGGSSCGPISAEDRV